MCIERCKHGSGRGRHAKGQQSLLYAHDTLQGDSDVYDLQTQRVRINMACAARPVRIMIGLALRTPWPHLQT